MYVVSGTNQRREHPIMNMVSLFESRGGKEEAQVEHWKQSFKKSPLDVLLTDVKDRQSISLTVRGYVHDISPTNRLTEVFLGGSRIPISETSVVTKRGNKIIVDTSFVVSLSDVNVVDDNTWSFRLSTPCGFYPMTLCSPESPTNYLYALVGEPSAMATEVSPVSFTLMWPQGKTLTPSVVINSVVVDLPSGSHNRMRVQASPQEDYMCVIDNGFKRYEVVLRTPGVSRESYAVHYRACRVGDGVYDLSYTNQDAIRDLRRFGVIRPGDRVILKGSSSPLLAVGSGETISASGSFYVIPSFMDDMDQYLCMETPEGSHVVTFDNTESFVGYDSKRYCHGENFVIGSRMVEVVKGSLILVVHDDVPLVFPGGVTTASQVSTAGDIVLRDLIMKSSSQVTTKVSGDFTYGLSSYYVYDSSNGTTLEVTRVMHGMDDAGEVGSISFNVLYTNSAGGYQTLHNALAVDPSKTTISTIDTTGSLEATFDSAGLKFNSNSGDVYFGASQEFRIHFEPSNGTDPSMLQIQGYDTSTSEYVTRQLITNEPVN